MGRSKSTRKPVVRPKVRLDKTFSCLFCHNDKVIECRLDRDQNIGTLHCRSCGVHWQTSIHYLSEPIDVFSEWIDACEAAQKEAVRSSKPPQTTASRKRRDQEDFFNEDIDDEERFERPRKLPSGKQQRPEKPAKKKSRHESDSEIEDSDDEPDDKDDDDGDLDGFIVKDDEAEEDEEDLF